MLSVKNAIFDILLGIEAGEIVGLTLVTTDREGVVSMQTPLIPGRGSVVPDYGATDFSACSTATNPSKSCSAAALREGESCK